MRIQQTETGFGDLNMVTHICICGSTLWNLQVTFDDYEIASYNLDMECAVCGTRAIAPTPIDHPDYQEF